MRAQGSPPSRGMIEVTSRAMFTLSQRCADAEKALSLVHDMLQCAKILTDTHTQTPTEATVLAAMRANKIDTDWLPTWTVWAMDRDSEAALQLWHTHTQGVPDATVLRMCVAMSSYVQSSSQARLVCAMASEVVQRGVALTVEALSTLMTQCELCQNQELAGAFILRLYSCTYVLIRMLNDNMC
jgi:hypothetical protein